MCFSALSQKECFGLLEKLVYQNQPKARVAYLGLYQKAFSINDPKVSLFTSKELKQQSQKALLDHKQALKKAKQLSSEQEKGLRNAFLAFGESASKQQLDQLLELSHLSLPSSPALLQAVQKLLQQKGDIPQKQKWIKYCIQLIEAKNSSEEKNNEAFECLLLLGNPRGFKLKTLPSEQKMQELLIEMMERSSSSERLRAIRFLKANEEVNGQAILSLGLKDSQSEIILESIEAIYLKSLKNIDSSEFLPSLRKLTQAKNDRVALNAFSLYFAISKQAELEDSYSHYLINTMYQEDQALLSDALEWIKRLKVEQALPELYTQLQEENETLQLQAIQAIKALKAQEAIPALIDVFENASPKVQQELLEAFVVLEAHAAIPILLRGLRELSSMDLFIGQLCARALLRIQPVNPDLSLDQTVFQYLSHPPQNNEALEKKRAALEDLISLAHSYGSEYPKLYKQAKLKKSSASEALRVISQRCKKITEGFKETPLSAFKEETREEISKYPSYCEYEKSWLKAKYLWRVLEQNSTPASVEKTTDEWEQFLYI